MEVIKHLLNLTNILLLHLSPRDALFAIGSWIWEQHLINDNVSNIDILLGELNRKSLCLIHTEELWDAHCHESCPLWVLELPVDLLGLLLHAVKSLEQFLVDSVGVHPWLSLTLHHPVHGPEHATELFFQFNQLYDGLLEDVWQV